MNNYATPNISVLQILKIYYNKEIYELIRTLGDAFQGLESGI